MCGCTESPDIVTPLMPVSQILMRTVLMPHVIQKNTQVDAYLKNSTNSTC